MAFLALVDVDGSTFATIPNKFVTFSSGILVFVFAGWVRSNLSSLFIIFSCFNSSCCCICCCIGSRNGVAPAVAAELLVVPTSDNAKVFELALTLFTVEEEGALVLASIGVEEDKKTQNCLIFETSLKFI